MAVSGGDGTVMEAMSALVGKDTPIAVFPAGTGNLLSINLGIPMTVPDAVDVALGGRQKFALWTSPAPGRAATSRSWAGWAWMPR